MKFLITWKLHPGKLHETLDRFAKMSAADEEALMGDGLKLIGRWHNLQEGSGAAVYEATDPAALANYSLHWNQFMDLDVSPVLDDEETRALGAKRTSP
jgi:hypothetical protein